MEKAILLFGVTYVLMLLLPKLRWLIALCGAAVFVLLGILPASKIFSSIDWNVIMMIAGTMGIVSLFIESKMPNLLSDLILEKTPNVKWAVIALSLFAGIISAFVDNVATVLMVAPIALAVSKRLNISPVPVIVSIAVSSNLQGAATLVGDTTSILLGGYANMDFLDFFVFHGRPSMFWAVQLGAVASALILMFLFRKDTQIVTSRSRTTVEDYFPTFLLVGTILLLIGASFIPNKPTITNGLICLGLLAVGMTRNWLKTKKTTAITAPLMEIDFFTLLLLAGIFVVIGGITEAGVVDAVADLFVSLSGDNLFLIYSLIVWASVLFSAFIDNIPYVATMLPVVSGIAGLLGVDPTLLYFGLLTGATLGGNLTPIGASANITGIGILRKAGYEVTTRDFMRVGIPFTLAAVVAGYLFIWVVFGI